MGGERGIAGCDWLVVRNHVLGGAWTFMLDKVLGVRVDLRSWFVLGLAWGTEGESAGG